MVTEGLGFNISPSLDFLHSYLICFLLFMQKMATKISSHARSTSLPTSSYPLLVCLEQHLDRLKSSEGTSSSSQASTCQKLDGLRNLYECLDDLLQLPLSQRVLSPERNGKWEEEVLDGSLRLLDICGTVRDIYSQMEESVQELKSSLRRRRVGELANEVDSYLISKKKLNKMICKCHKEMKSAEKNCSLPLVNDDKVHLVKLIKQVQEVSLAVLESTLSFISGRQPRGWSLLSKLLQSKGPSSQRESEGGIQKIEAQLLLLNCKKSNKDRDLQQMQNLLKQLEAFDLSSQELVEVLQVVFRLLLKSRVSLLNAINN